MLMRLSAMAPKPTPALHAGLTLVAAAVQAVSSFQRTHRHMPWRGWLGRISGRYRPPLCTPAPMRQCQRILNGSLRGNGR